jgi:hypothetical protein
MHIVFSTTLGKEHIHVGFLRQNMYSLESHFEAQAFLGALEKNQME